MRILKFGGSSVGSPERIRKVGKIVRRRWDETGGELVLVVSAFQGVTDELLALTALASSGSPYAESLKRLERRHQLDALELGVERTVASELDMVEEILGEVRVALAAIGAARAASPELVDAVTSAGERLSAVIVAASLSGRGAHARAQDARALVRTDDRFGAAQVAMGETYGAIRRWRELAVDGGAGEQSLPVVTGFIGATADGRATTLGRGGSDYTAALFGAALDADAIEIWTDVDGMMSADPRAVPGAFTLDALTYAEAMELAHFGAKVIFPPAMRPAMARSIPLEVRNSFRPNGPFTRIGAARPSVARPITGLTAIPSVALLRLEGSGLIGAPGIAQRLFGALARQRINVILVSQASSEHSICFALEPRDAAPAVTAIEAEFASEMAAGAVDPVAVMEDCAVIAVVGEEMRERPGIAGALFSALGARGVNVIAIAQGSSERNISLVVAADERNRALNAIHDAFFSTRRPEVNVFLAGAGLVGSTLLQQLAELASSAGDRPLPRLRGMLNSTRMLLAGEDADVSLESWRDDLAARGQPTDLEAFIAAAVACRAPHVTLVDCTASDALPARYPELLRAGVSVVTPNKRGPAGGLALAAETRRAAVSAASGARYLHETAVGAALPVISTLRDLLATGDEVERIEGVLSGTLSYLFNAFDGARPFSACLMEAQRLGYTEPDPRDDLNGMDVARKLLILGRELGLALELGNIHIEPLLSPECLAAPSVVAFWEALARDDARLDARRAEAASHGRVLRYVAWLEGGAVRVGLQGVAADSPFARLSGADNMIVFTTRRYHQRPLVIQGPGAGAEVTAAGVLADILRVAAPIAAARPLQAEGGA